MDERSCLYMFRKHCNCYAADVLFAGRFLTVKKRTGKASELYFSVVTVLPVTIFTAASRVAEICAGGSHCSLSFSRHRTNSLMILKLDFMHIFPPTPKLYDVKRIHFYVKKKGKFRTD